MIIDLDMLISAHGLYEQFLTSVYFVKRYLRFPLERRKRFRNKSRKTYRDKRPLARFIGNE